MFHRIIRLLDVYEGLVMPVTVAGHQLLYIHQHGEDILVQRHCPHGGRALDNATLDGRQLRCPGHGLTFDLKTGLCVEQPQFKLARFSVVYDGQWLAVDI